MTGRGIDQALPYPSDPRLYESFVKSAKDYVMLAERKNGSITRPVSFEYVWGAALDELKIRRPDARIINLETAITTSALPAPKGIHYKMNPANVGVIVTAGIDGCVLANNHVLDWGQTGLLETLQVLGRACVNYAGAGVNAAEAARPAVLGSSGTPVFVFAFASGDSGVARDWAAGPNRPGVNFIPELSARSAEEIAERIRSQVGMQHPVIASIHWGGNWGYAVPEDQMTFAHRLIDSGCIDVIHGHSSHHVKGIEVYRKKLILYGCGDLINDYEGIAIENAYRDDLSLMYFPRIHIADGTLASLEMVPMHICKMRLNRASREDAQYLADTLNREGQVLGTQVILGSDNVLLLEY